MSHWAAISQSFYKWFQTRSPDPCIWLINLLHSSKIMGATFQSQPSCKTVQNIERKYLLLVLRCFLFKFCPLESQFLLNLCKVNSLWVNLSARTRHQSRDLFSFGIFELKTIYISMLKNFSLLNHLASSCAGRFMSFKSTCSLNNCSVGKRI